MGSNWVRICRFFTVSNPKANADTDDEALYTKLAVVVAGCFVNGTIHTICNGGLSAVTTVAIATHALSANKLIVKMLYMFIT